MSLVTALLAGAYIGKIPLQPEGRPALAYTCLFVEVAIEPLIGWR